MCLKRLIISLFFILLTQPAVAADISGRIVGENGTPLSGCKVSLPSVSKEAVTTADGKFFFADVNSLISHHVPSDLNPRLKNGTLHFSLPPTEIVTSLKILGVSGKQIFSPLPRRSAQGEYTVNLNSLLEHQSSPTLYIVNIKGGEHTYSFKIFLSKSTQGYTSAMRLQPAALKKETAGSVILQAACSGFAERKLPITSGNMGDITIGRPNIILMLVDDMGYSDIGSYGGEISTPNLDKLAFEGVRFQQFYNYGMCVPTRASLVSGLYSHDAGNGLKKGITLGQAMQAGGYTTMAIGKWHMDGTPEKRGFDRAFGHLSGASTYFSTASYAQFHLDGKPFNQPSGDWYLTDKNTDFAMQFIEEEKQKNPGKPFFLYFAINAPHNPLHALPEDVAKYRGKYKAKGWDVLRKERFERQLAMGLFPAETAVLSERSRDIPAWNNLTDSQQDKEDHVAAVYAGMMDRVDQNVGRLMAKLGELGMQDNTLFMFLSDNGSDGKSNRGGTLNTPNSNWQRGSGWANLGNTPFKHYKYNQHQGGICTPFFAWWPQVISNKGTIIKNYPGHLVDIMPTINELANWQYPKSFQGKSIPALPGKSLVPLFEGKSLDPPDALNFAFSGEEAIVSGIWKLVAFRDGQWELYNLQTDPAETKDLAKQQPAKVQELLGKWNAYVSSRNISTRGGGQLDPYVKF